jgi:hypothetical protein
MAAGYCDDGTEPKNFVYSCFGVYYTALFFWTFISNCSSFAEQSIIMHNDILK